MVKNLPLLVLSGAVVASNLITLTIGLLFSAQPIIFLPITAIVCTGFGWLFSKFLLACVVVSTPVPVTGLIIVIASRTGNLHHFLDYATFPAWLDWMIGGFGDNDETTFEKIFKLLPEGGAWFTLVGGGGVLAFHVLAYLDSREKQRDRQARVGFKPLDAPPDVSRLAM